MSCPIKNPANYQLGDLEGHIHGMYDHFASKYDFQKSPTVVFDSEPDNQADVLGKTAYYDPQSMEIHIFCDGRHPKDMLRSIAHELIHHRQNLEGRLASDGYNGPGYYLENDELKQVEHEAMLEGNATMREYEDTKKYKENKDMSLKEWRNKELNQLLMKKFGILKEEKEETLEEGELPKGLKDWKAKNEKGADNPDNENEKGSKKSDSDDDDTPDSPAGAQEEETEATNEAYVARKEPKNEEATCGDVKEESLSSRPERQTEREGNKHQGRMEEELETTEDEIEEGGRADRPENFENFQGQKEEHEMRRATELRESLKRLAKAKKIFFKNKRIK